MVLKPDRGELCLYQCRGFCTLSATDTGFPTEPVSLLHVDRGAGDYMGVMHATLRGCDSCCDV